MIDPDQLNEIEAKLDRVAKQVDTIHFVALALFWTTIVVMVATATMGILK